MPQFKNINSSALSLLYGPTLTSVHDYWKKHSFDYMNFVSKVMSLLFNMLSRFIIAFLPRSSVQFSSVAQLCLTLCDPMDCNTPGFPVLHHLLEVAQVHVHWVSDAIQPSHSLLPPSPPAPFTAGLRVWQLLNIFLTNYRQIIDPLDPSFILLWVMGK